jgi:hypothetical protein
MVVGICIQILLMRLSFMKPATLDPMQAMNGSEIEVLRKVAAKLNTHDGLTYGDVPEFLFFKVCTICCIVKPPMTSHCSSCDSCI